MRCERWRALTLELLQHALDGTGAATAAHGDVELVVVLGHDCRFVCMCGVGCVRCECEFVTEVLLEEVVMVVWSYGEEAARRRML